MQKRPSRNIRGDWTKARHRRDAARKKKHPTPMPLNQQTDERRARQLRLPFPKQKPSATITHPTKTHYRAVLINSGKEAALYHLPHLKVVHKFWRQAWILSHYHFYNSRGQLYKKAGKRLARQFGSDEHTGALVERKGVEHHGLPVEKFKMITFVLSYFSEDVIKQARAVGIPTPPIARAVRHPKKDLYILEMSDLSKKWHKIISGNDLRNYHSQHPVANYDRVMASIEEDIIKLRELGYVEDIELHPKYSAWLIRINEKTGKAQRFLWDVTNLKMK